jgi:hypothetical protein
MICERKVMVTHALRLVTHGTRALRMVGGALAT